QERKIRALNDRLMTVQEQERIRLARELHDGVMQEMLAVTMMLGSAKRAAPDGSGAKAKIDAVQERLIRMGTDLRRVSHDLYPAVLDEEGLPKAVETYCEQFSTASGIPIACEADESARVVSRNAALAVSDDEVGIHLGRLDAGRGLGLATMGHRATQLDGHLQAESDAGAKTLI